MGTVLESRPRLRALLRSSTPGRWWDAPAALLLLAALFITVGRLIVTSWTDHLDLVQVLALLGAISGLALGQSAFSSRRVTIFALLYGLYTVSWQLGLTLARISDDALWSDRLYNLGTRLVNSFLQLMRQEPVTDPLLFMFFMACLSWGLGVYAGYTLTRHANAWRAILPAGLMLLVIQNYDPFWPGRVWYLAAFLFFALLLVARSMYLRHRARWQQERVFLPTYVGMDFARTTLQVTILLVLVAWGTPAVANTFSPVQSVWRDVSRPWLSIRDRLENVVAALRDQVGGVASVYGESLFLGKGSELTDDITLVVETQPSAPTPARYYWRARIYDYYENGQWSTTIVSDTLRFDPDDPELVLPETEQLAQGEWTSAFTVTTSAPISTLFIPSQFLWTSHSAQMDVAPNPDGTTDIAAIHANPAVNAGGAYHVQSFFKDVTIAQLRSAGTDYPSWVTDRYLQLPIDMSPRVRELARQITFDLDNPYDMVAAITLYLRTYIRFSEVIPSDPVAGQDPLEWFLFDVREGYCTYYASAEVAMLRSLGVPARMAVGYAEGQREAGEEIYMIGPRSTKVWSAGSQLYVVRHQDAHAWPEVYFPGLGWVEFEPTVSQPPLYRPLGEESDELPEDALSLLDVEPERRNRWEEIMEEMDMERGGAPYEPVTDTASLDPKMAIALLSLSLGLSVILLVLVWRRRTPRNLTPFPVIMQRGFSRFDLQPPAALARWVVYATLSPLARAYVEVNSALIRLGAPPAPADTPAERTMALSRLLPEAAGSARQLLTEYQDTVYGIRPGNLSIAQQAGRDIRRLSWQVVIRKFLARLRR